MINTQTEKDKDGLGVEGHGTENRTLSKEQLKNVLCGKRLRLNITPTVVRSAPSSPARNESFISYE